MTLRLDKLLKGATASAFALVMFTGCNTFEGMGEDVADAGDAIQDIGDSDSSEQMQYSDRVEVASSETRQSSDRDWIRSESDSHLQAQRLDAGLYTASGRRIDAQQRQQMASNQMRNQSQQQIAQRRSDQDRSTEVFGFAEDQAARDQQNQQKLSGTIQDVARVPHVTLKTEDGREVIALLKEDQIRQLQLQQGQKVTLTGSMRDHEGKQLFVVDSVQKEQKQSERGNENPNAFGFAADQQDKAHKDQKADKAHKKHALVGTVQKIEEVQGEKGPHITVKSDKGDKTYRVDLTGVEEAKLLKTEINEGDKVTLIGSIVKADHGQHGQAQQDQQQQDQQQNQQQASSKQQAFKAEKLHKGVVAEVMQTYAFVGEGENVSGKLSNLNAQAEGGASASITTQEGRDVRIDLSQIDRSKLQSLNLQNDQQVTVMGSYEQKNGQQVFVATDIRQGVQQEGQQQEGRQQDQPQQDQPAQRSNQAPQNQPQP